MGVEAGLGKQQTLEETLTSVQATLSETVTRLSNVLPLEVPKGVIPDREKPNGSLALTDDLVRIAHQILDMSAKVESLVGGL